MGKGDRESDPGKEGRVAKLLARLRAVFRRLPPERKRACREWVDEQKEGEVPRERGAEEGNP